MSFPPPPAPRVRGFKGGQNMWTNAMFEALGWAFWPSPPAPLPFWERGDSGARVWHPIAVHSYYEHLFCPPLNGRGGWAGSRESTRSRNAGYPPSFTLAQVGRVGHKTPANFLDGAISDTLMYELQEQGIAALSSTKLKDVFALCYSMTKPSVSTRGSGPARGGSPKAR
jgi:hypothetical protein